MATRKDPGWNHCTLVNPKNVNEGLKCNYCNKVTKGGISRHKQHLAGGYRNAIACKKVPEFVKQEMKDHLIERQNLKNVIDKIPHFDDIADQELEEEETEDMEIQSSGKRQITSSSSEASNRSTAAQKKKSKQMGPIDWFFVKDSDDVVKERKKGEGASQFNETKKKLRDNALQKFARWMYDAGLPFNAVKYDSFASMIEAIGQYGAGMKPPSYHELRVTCLNKEVEHTNNILKKHREEMAKFGCTLMADGWRDRKGRSLINFLVNTPRGSMFVESIDASRYSHTGDKMFELLDAFVQRVGEENVVQVVTDSASSNVVAGEKLMGKYKHLYWTPCAAHCLDLMFEDIFKMPDLKRTFERAITVNGYIYNRTQVLNMLRDFTGKKEMVRHAKTRFATAFLTLRRFHLQKSNLRKMFTSDRWNKSKFAKEQAGKNVAKIVLMTSFWRTVAYAMKFAGPLVEVLRLVDGEKKPAMGYIYEAMDTAKEKIALAFGKNEERYREIFEIIDRRWNCQLHRPLHAAGYYLNPYFFYDNEKVQEDAEVMSGLYDCLTRLVKDTSTQDLIAHEIIIYKKAEGNFSKDIAKRQRKLLAPAEWWASFGSSTPNLQKLAIKILSLTCSSSGCERNWSVFEHLHSKKRNRLEQKKLNDLVYVKYNRALLRRYEMRDTIDPIILDNVEFENEWLVGRMEQDDEDEEDAPVFENEDLTWGDVEEASGVNEPIYSFRSRGSSSTKSRPTTSRETIGTKRKAPSSSLLRRIDEEEELDDGDEEEEEEEEKDNECYKSSDDEARDDFLGNDFDDDDDDD